MDIQVIGGATLSASDQVFDKPFNEALVHQAVVAYMAGARAGTKAQKSRSEVRGGGKKPWRQKGTGRARAGTIRSPLWRKGGVTFAAKPRNHAQKLNKKMYRGALASILSELVRSGGLQVIDALSVAAPKTKELAARLKELGLSSVTIVVDALDDNLVLAARNLPQGDVLTVSELNPVALLRNEKVLVTVPAMKQIEEWLS